MNNYTKIEIAKEIIYKKIADALQNGFDPNNKEIIKLMKEEQELRKLNFKVINKIINVYTKEHKKDKTNINRNNEN